MFDLTVLVFVLPLLLALALVLERTRLGFARIRKQLRSTKGSLLSRIHERP